MCLPTMRQPSLKPQSLFSWERDKENVTRELEHHKRGLWTETKSIDFSDFFHSPFSLLTLISLCMCWNCREKETWESLCPSSSERKSLRDWRPQYTETSSCCLLCDASFYILKRGCRPFRITLADEQTRPFTDLISCGQYIDQPELSFHTASCLFMLSFIKSWFYLPNNVAVAERGNKNSFKWFQDFTA